MQILIDIDEMAPGKVVILITAKGKCSREEKKYVEHITAGMNDIVKTACEKFGYSESGQFEIKIDRPAAPTAPE